MERVIAWFVHNPVAANLAMVMIIAMGLSTFPMLPKQFFPERELDLITVSVSYPGAGPSEVEQQICLRLEEAVYDLDGIDRLRCSAIEGSGLLTLEVAGDYDSLRLLNAVRSRVDAIRGLPLEAERPQVVEQLWRAWIMSVVVAGDIGEANLKELGQQLRDELAALPGVQHVLLERQRDYELGIELSELSLRRYGLRFEDVVDAVRASSLNIPAGKLSTSDGDIQVQARGQSYGAADFEEIVLLRRPDGTRVLLGDVAEVVDGFEELDISADFNGRPFVSLDVYGASHPDILKTRDAVYTFVEALGQRLPPGMETAVWRDQSVSFQGRLSTLLYNGIGGLVLVFAVLFLFLRPLLALWVSLGIAVAFLGAIWLLPLTGATLNVISLFAFILILGIVVDDAIIVGESVYAHQAGGFPGPVAAVRGTVDVLKPVWFAVITTMLFFGSFLLLPDSAPAATEIAKVVLVALGFSLLECMFILPAHLAHMRPERVGRHPKLARLERWRERVARSIEVFAESVYQPLLAKCMAHRGLTLATFTTALLLALSFYLGGWMESSFFPRVPANYLIANVVLPEGGPMSAALAVKQRVDAAARRLEREVNVPGEPPLIEHIQSVARKEQVNVSLALGRGDRDLSTVELKQRWQDHIGALPQAQDFEISYTIGRGGKDISLRLAAPDVDTLGQAAAEVSGQLALYPGVFNVRNSLAHPQAEIELVLKPLAESLDITLADVARQVRRGFYGEEVQRIPRLREDVKVMVRYPRREREAVSFLQNMRIRAPDGREVPFEAVAAIRYVAGYSKIERVDRRRTSIVSAELEPGFSAESIVAAVLERHLADWQARFPGFRINLDGAQEDRAEFLAQLKRLLTGTLLIVYGMMAIAFRSYWQPILILVAIPFGFMGAIVGHLLFDKEMSMFSILGIIACAGVVINDNLVLIDRVNNLRGRGRSLADALLQGGRDRFRPIVLTSMTTFVGLLPITLERSTQAQFLVPMVLSLTFGVLFATGVTLLFVPCLYLQLEPLVGWIKRVADAVIRPLAGSDNRAQKSGPEEPLG